MKFLHNNINKGSARVLKKIGWTKLKLKNDVTKTPIAILSTFTAEPMVPYFGYDLADNMIHANLWTAPYNQVIQQCLNPESETHKFNPEIMIIWPRFEDIAGQLIPVDEESMDTIYQSSIEMVDAGIKAAKELNSKLIFVLPAIIDLIPFGLGDDNVANGVHSVCAYARQAMRKKLVESGIATILDMESIVRKIGSQNIGNPSLYFAAKIPFSEELFDITSDKLVRLIKGRASQAEKLIVIDSVGVFWNSSANDEITKQTESLSFFGSYLEILKRSGAKIALVSKNSEVSTREEFKKQNFVGEELIDTWVFDVKNYASSISTITDKTKIASENILLLSTQQDLVKEFENTTLNLTFLLLKGDSSAWVSTINSLDFISFQPAFNLSFLNNKVETKADETETSGLDSFLAKLNLGVELKLCEEQHIEQVEHLIEASHDFNISSHKRTVEELKAYQSGNIYTVKVNDRFGDYGISGTVISENRGEQVFIDTFIMNCRVLGKNAEYRVLEKFIETEKIEDEKAVVFEYIQTDRNGAAKKFLTQLVPKSCIEENEGGFIATISCHDLKKCLVKTNNNQISSCSVDSVQSSTNGNSSASFIKDFVTSRIQKYSPAEYGKILSETALVNSNIDNVLTAVQQFHQRKRPNQTVAYVAPRTKTESKIVEIWQKLIGIEQVGVHDNFFYIGGHSILATQLILYFEKAFELKLPIRLFFENPTVAMIAQTVENMKNAPDKKDKDEVAVSNFRYITSSFLKSEAYLDESIHPGKAKEMPTDFVVKNIFLTGATGFLGAFILYHLLKKTDAFIYCLARGKNETLANIRIIENLKFYSLWSNSFSDRIINVEGDLQKPLLGLSKSKFEWLSEEVDVIYHCGAVTNFIDPYQKMKDANVLGTQEILRMACETKIKPVHFVSTHYVFSAASHKKDEWIKEEEMPNNNEIITLGYQQSKWVAEHLIDIARQRGIPA